jgi:hypothetical protein
MGPAKSARLNRTSGEVASWLRDFCPDDPLSFCWDGLLVVRAHETHTVMNPYQASKMEELENNLSNAISPFAVLLLTVLWPTLVTIGWIAGDWNQTYRHSSIWSGTHSVFQSPLTLVLLFTLAFHLAGVGGCVRNRPRSILLAIVCAVLGGVLSFLLGLARSSI